MKNDKIRQIGKWVVQQLQRDNKINESILK